MLNCVQGNVLRFLPPLILTVDQVDHAIDVLEEVLSERLTRRVLVDAQVASVA